MRIIANVENNEVVLMDNLGNDLLLKLPSNPILMRLKYAYYLPQIIKFIHKPMVIHGDNVIEFWTYDRVKGLTYDCYKTL